MITKELKKINENIVGLNKSNLVSTDFMRDRRSSIIDYRHLIVKQNHLELMVWYDNEYGYTSRIIDLINKISFEQAQQSSNNKKKNLLAVVTKYPRFYNLNTRLAKEIGFENARNIYLTSIKDIQLEHAWQKEYDLRFSVNSKGKLKEYLMITGIPQVKEITSKDLACHLYNTFNKCLKKHEKVIIIPADVPQISKKIIIKALSFLDNNDFVIGGTIDGGYYLVGLKKPVDLFTQIIMGDSNVFTKTMDLAIKKGLKVKKLKTLMDLDTFTDLKMFVKRNENSIAKNTINLSKKIIGETK